MREVQALMAAGLMAVTGSAAVGDTKPSETTETASTSNGMGEWWKWRGYGADDPPGPAADASKQDGSPIQPGGVPAVPPSLTQLTLPGAEPDKPHFVHNRDSIPDRPDVVFPFDGRLVFDTRAGVGSSPASVSVARSALAGNLVFGPEHDLQMSFPVDWELSTYSFRNANAIVPGGDDRFRNVQQIVFAPNIEGKLNEQWGLFGGGLLIDAGQYGADDTTTYGGYGGVVWRPDKSLTLRLGVGARTQLEDHVDVFPAFWLEWKLTERARLTSEGYNIRFEYDLNEAWCVKLDAAFEKRAYRLDSDGPGAHGVLRDNEVPITARLEFVPHAAARFEAWIGFEADREFTVDLSKDVRYSRTHASPALICGISFEIIF